MDNGSLFLGLSFRNGTTWEVRSNSTAQSSSHINLLLSSIILATNAFGVVANAVVFIATMTFPALRKSSSAVLIAHAVAIDFFFAGISTPLNAILAIFGPSHPLPSYFCPVYAMYGYAAFVSNLYATSLLAIQRLIAVVAPFHFARFRSKKAAVHMVVFPWMFAFTVNLFPALSSSGLTMVRVKSTGNCALGSTSKSGGPLMAYNLMSAFIPTGVMGMAYVILLVRTGAQVRAEGEKRGTSQRNMTLKRRLDIPGALFISFLWHCLTIYPFVITTIFFRDAYEKSVAVQAVMRWLSSSYSAMNPVFLCRCSRLFYSGVKAEVCCNIKHLRVNTVDVVSSSKNNSWDPPKVEPSRDAVQLRDTKQEPLKAKRNYLQVEDTVDASV